MRVKRHESTGIDVLGRSYASPAPTTRLAPNPPSLRLGQAGAFGVLLFVASTAIIAAVELPLGPFGLPLICSAWSALGIYGISLIGMDLLILAVEQFTGRDIDGDGQVGQPAPIPADRIVPVYHGKNVSTVDIPSPPQIDEDDRPLRLLPSDRAMPKREVFDYMEAAFTSGDWTRDGRPGNINTKEWSDLRGFVKAYYPRVWETTDRPTLDWFVRKIRNTGAN